MSRTMYGNKRLIPVQSVVVAKNYQKTPDGTKVGSLFNLAVNGTLLAYKGSPMTSGFWTNTGYPPDETSIVADETQRLKSILRKKEYLRELFAEDGLSFEVQSDDGTPPMKCNPRVLGIDFKENIEHTICQYTINLEADILHGGPFLAPSGEDRFAHMLSDASEDWNMEINDSPEFAGQDQNTFASKQTYRLTHNLSAVGKRHFDEDGNLVKPAWEWAKEWVQPRLGINYDRITSTGVLNLPLTYDGYNHLRAESIDELGGRYAVTESWIIATEPAIENFSVTSRKDSSTSLTTVVVEGQVQGLDIRDSSYQLTQNKYQSAEIKFNEVDDLVFIRAQALTGLTLNVRPITQQIQRLYSQGSIQYSVEYNNRPSNYITGAIWEDIQIQGNVPVDVFASIAVLGRAAGPVLQPLGTITAPTRTLSVQAVMERQEIVDLPSAFNNNPRAAGLLTSIINSATPAINGFTQVYLSDFNEQWNPFTGNYSLNITWTYQA